MSKNKLDRNDPCYCGSGRKYKKCCLKKEDRIMEKKENEFAKEVAASKISPAEEMNRNQAVHMFYLQARKSMLAADKIHLQSQIDMFVGVRTDIMTMLDCECKVGTLVAIKQQTEQHQKALDGCHLGGLEEMTLDALERLGNLTLASEAVKEVSVN